MPENFYQPVSFHFRVDFIGLEEKQDSIDTRFQSVSGLTVNFETETIKEGGENRFQHVLPLRTQYADLVLKRGFLKPADSAVARWCVDAFTFMNVRPIDLKVVLLNQAHQPLISWEVIHAWPKRWSVSDMNAEQSAILIETLELHYNHFKLLE